MIVVDERIEHLMLSLSSGMRSYIDESIARTKGIPGIIPLTATFLNAR